MNESQQRTKKFEEKLRPARGFDTYSWLACLAISAFLIVWITLASGSFNLRSALFLVVLPWVLLRAGGIISAAIRLPSFFAFDFLLGVGVVSVVILAWKVFVPFSLWVLLITLLVAIASIPRLLPRHRRDPLSALGLLSVIVLSRCSNRLVSRSDFPYNPSRRDHCFQAMVGFFHSCHLCGRAVWHPKLCFKLEIMSGKDFQRSSTITRVTLSRYVWRR